MTKETFKGVLKSVASVKEYLENCKKVRLDLSETALDNEYWWMLDTIIENTYEDHGQDMFYWWIYEKSNNPDLKAYLDGEEIINNEDELYDYLKEYERTK